MSNRNPSSAPMDTVGASRAERLLDAMHKVFSHDLPNQLVVVQSLISLMDEEEKQLTPDGLEHLRRLRLAAGRASNMVHFLKDMARLAQLAESLEDVRLSALTRELQAELHQMYPERDIRIETNWQLPSIFAARRSLQQALVQLLRCGIEHFPSQAVTAHLSSVRIDSAMEILVHVRPGDALALSNKPPLGHDRTLPEQRLEFVLAKELLALWGGTLAARPQPGQTCCFAIGIPTHVKYA